MTSPVLTAPHCSVPAPPAQPERSPAETTWFPVDSTAVGSARRRVAEVLSSWGVVGECLEDAELLVSELAANVVAHTHARSFGVAVRGAERRVTISVKESTVSPLPVPDTHTLTRFVPPPQSAPTEVHGRGLAIIEAIAVEWGISRTRRSTSTWFTLEPSVALPVTVVSPRAAAELAMTQAGLRRTQLLLRVTERLSAATTAAQVGDTVTGLLGEHLGAMFTGIALIDIATMTGPNPTMRYVDLSVFPDRTRHEWARIELAADAPVASVARSSTAEFHASAAEADAAHPGIAEHMHVAGTAALAHLPLLADGACHGTLALAWAAPRDFDADTRALLTIVAGYAAQALNRRDSRTDAATAARRRWSQASADFDEALDVGAPMAVLQRLDDDVRRAAEAYCTTHGSAAPGH